jgi:hypothetical protein
VSDRVRVLQCDVRALAGDVYDLVWLPGPFLPFDVVAPALRASYRSLSAGGWLAFGLYGGPPDPLAQQLADLRTVRSGGHPWTLSEVVGAVEGAGFAGVIEVERTWNAPLRLVVGRRP